jgi:hypothetical protein
MTSGYCSLRWPLASTRLPRRQVLAYVNRRNERVIILDPSGACLTIWIGSLLSLLLRDVAVSLCAFRSLVCGGQIMPSFITPLRATPLTAPHRHGREKHHKHDCDGDHDYHDSRPYGQGDQQGLFHSAFSQVASPDWMIPGARRIEADLQS